MKKLVLFTLFLSQILIAQLKENEILVTIQVTPADATIIVDGVTLKYVTTTILTSGKHNLRVEKSGYTPFSKEIVVSPDNTWFEVNLTKIQLSPVTIRSNPPNATVFINDEYKGTTELGLFLNSGSYNLRLELLNYMVVSEKIEVIPSTDKTKNIFDYSLISKKGSLQLSVIPSDAKITLNGKLIPAGLSELMPGKYILEASANKYDGLQEEIEIKQGETLKKELNLTKNSGLLMLDIQPAHALVTINKEKRFDNSFELLPGLYEIEISAETYFSETMTIQIERGKTVSKWITLKQKTGTLQFTVKPLDAIVTLSQNGKIKHQWEGMNLLTPIIEGVYDLTAKSTNHQSYSGKIVIKEGQITVKDLLMAPGGDIPKWFVLVDGKTFNKDGYEWSSFFISKFEVTNGLWDNLMGYNYFSYPPDNKQPVLIFQWKSMIDFCNKLSEKEGLQKAYSYVGGNLTCDFNSNGYRLPIEAEWEYAARGGKKSNGYKYSGSNNIDEVAWYQINSENNSHPVGSKHANELGLFDMSGNVWEWCWDEEDASSFRILRGGALDETADKCQIISRDANIFGYLYFTCFGFRLVRTK